MNSFETLQTTKPICFGYFSSNPPISVWLACVTDIERSSIASFCSQNPQYNIENWLLVPKDCLTWTKEQIVAFGYSDLQETANALETKRDKRDLTRSERIKKTILSKTWRNPAGKHKLIWQFRARMVPKVGEVLSIVWATERALEAFKNQRLKQLELFD